MLASTLDGHDILLGLFNGPRQRHHNESVELQLLAAVPPELQELLKQFPRFFPDDLPEGLPPQRAHDHRIELEHGAQPAVQRQFRLTQPDLDELRKQLDYMLEKKFIRPSSSPLAAPILFTPKKDEGFRMCINYRALNRVTIKSRYPIPRTAGQVEVTIKSGALIDQLRIARVFSKIDLHGGYHKIRVEPSYCAKTAFRTRYESFKYTVMPFGLTNSSATFQITMNEAFRPLVDKYVIIYLNDILVYSPDKQQHFADLEALFTVLDKLTEHGSGFTTEPRHATELGLEYHWRHIQLKAFLGTISVN
ncbi:unnamed protein product [Closterium sp. NIES-53]